MTQDNLKEGWPSELRLNPEKNLLQVTFLDASAETLSAELLRINSPSAEVQGHSPSERKLVAGKSRVTIRDLEPVGNYAIRIVFSDGHDTGIYTWPYLRELTKNKEELWRSYLRELEEAGLGRG